MRILEGYVNSEHIGFLPRVEGSVEVIGIPVVGSLRVDVLGMLLQWRPVSDILACEVEPDIVDSYLLRELGRDGVSH